METQSQTFAPTRFEEGGEMRIVGLRQYFTFEEMQQIPQLWERFVPIMDQAPRVDSHVSYGMVMGGGPDAKGVDYMCGVEIAPDTAVPDGMVIYEVPAHKYAVFVHPGSTSTLEKTIDQIFHAWLPASHMELALTPDFLERYGPGFNPETMSGDIEIWVPVK